MGNYYSYKETAYTCKACGWGGLGKDCKKAPTDKYFDDSFCIECPKCSEEIEVLDHPTIDEMLSSDNDTDKATASLILAKRKQFQEASLKSTDQLPEIEEDSIVLTWDVDDRQSPKCVLIKHGSKIIWNEPPVYEGYSRFMNVGDILRKKYGRRLKDIIPTERSELFLYGDDISSPESVKKYRKAVSEGREPRDFTAIVVGLKKRQTDLWRKGFKSKEDAQKYIDYLISDPRSDCREENWSVIETKYTIRGKEIKEVGDAEYAEIILADLAKQVIKELKTWTKGARRNNLWEDIVDQVQIQHYLFWGEYEKIVDGVIDDLVKKLSQEEIKFLWQNSDKKEAWEEERDPYQEEMSNDVNSLIRGIVLGRADEEECSE